MERDLLGELGVIMTSMTRRSPGILLDTDTIPMKDRDSCTLSSVKALIEIYVIANEPQTIRDEYSQSTEILDTEYKPESLHDIIKTCESLHVEEQHQFKILLQIYEHLFDGTLREFNMEIVSISLQLMDHDCKLIHA
jgi:hypothetical protein